MGGRKGPRSSGAGPSEVKDISDLSETTRLQQGRKSTDQNSYEVKMSSMGTKAARIKKGEREGNAQVKERDKASGSEDEKHLNMQLDLALFDCPVCYEPVNLPLFQCRNGHIICSGCCEKLQKKCPICTLSISSLRCVMLEAIIESNKVSCSFALDGCQQLVPYNDRQIHERSCTYAPCFCPDPDCTFEGPVQKLYSHIQLTHLCFGAEIRFSYDYYERVSVQKQQFLRILRHEQEGEWEGDRIYLLANRRFSGGDKGFSGNALSVVCIRAGDEEDGRPVSYELRILDNNSGGRLKLEGVIQCKREWKDGQFPKCCLYVPDELSERGHIVVDVCITSVKEDEVDQEQED